MKYCKSCSSPKIKGASFCNVCGDKMAIKKTNRYRNILVIAGIVIFIYVAFANFPTQFRIGQVDSRFGISKNEVISMSKDAAKRWNQALDREALVYDNDASLTIDLVYDRRQAELDKLEAEVENITLARDQLSAREQELDNLVSEYEIELDEYERDVDFWNSSSRASEAQYQTLSQRQKDLEDENSRINSEIDQLNSSIDVHNSNIANLNNEIEEKSRQLEKVGAYKDSDNKIDIYVFTEKNLLRLTLMHELGHAIGGLEHTDNPSSIMYSLIDKQNLEDPRPQQEDIDAVD